MSLSPGARLGGHEVQSLIGAGGMGEVYRARDLTLGRDVALKVLPDGLAADPERVARLRREAHLLASLNHPNIAAIYGLELGGDAPALVLELVDGPTLADRLALQPFPLDEALGVARQIAAALEAAHEHGIIHRDLKPSNIKLRDDGTVKVLDFGLARFVETAEAGAPGKTSGAVAGTASLSPTITSPALMTGAGMILGTAAYMAPEQARGRAVDTRADIWAFGCVLFEMLAGRRPFDGGDVTDVLASVIKSDPDWTLLPEATPAPVRRLLARCLQKDPKRRLRHIGDAVADIDEALAAPAGVPRDRADRARTRERLAWSAALVAAAAAAAALMVAMRPTPAPPEMRLQVATPAPPDLDGAMAFALSPDGSAIAYVIRSADTTQIWIRRFDAQSATVLEGTERASMMRWSPDGRSLAFGAAGRIRRVDVSGGNLQALTDGTSGFGISWGRDGSILFARGNASPISRVSASGGSASEVTRLETGHTGHRFPDVLPDGRRFLYYVLGTADVRGIYLGQLDGESRRLFDAETAGVFLAPDYVLYGRGNTLVAQRVDLDTARPVGDPVAVAEGIATSPTLFASIALSVSDAGTIAYRTANPPLSRLVWLDRTGSEIGAVAGPPQAVLRNLALSPDDRSAAVVRVTDNNEDLWIVDLERSTWRRLTFDPADDVGPAWSPDAARIAFYSGRRSGGGGINDLYVAQVGQPGADQPLLEDAENKNLGDWSPDGRYLLYASQSPERARDIRALPLDGDRTPIALVQTRFEETSPTFSPDGRWIAYQSSETGRAEVYVRPFLREGAAVQVSTGGGTVPRWAAPGEIVFRSDAGAMAVAVTVDGTGETIRAATPVRLFELSPNASIVPASDGRRFLVRLPLDDAVASPITLLLNWTPPRR